MFESTSKMKLIVLLYVISALPKLVFGRYTLGVKDSFMIAHSFHNHPAFGPAGGMVRPNSIVDVPIIPI